MKTFALAVVAALSLGIGGAMAQSEVPGNAGVDYWAGKARTEVPVAVQAGSSDISPAHPVINYTTLANPG